MKSLLSIALLLALLSASLLVSTAITMVAWHSQISGRAFQCNDDNFSGYWLRMDEHRLAGDTISAGWTWASLEDAREIYILAFFLLWSLGTIVPFWILRREPKRKADETSA